jgi:hypothetical protein
MDAARLWIDRARAALDRAEMISQTIETLSREDKAQLKQFVSAREEHISQAARSLGIARSHLQKQSAPQ